MNNNNSITQLNTLINSWYNEIDKHGFKGNTIYQIEVYKGGAFAYKTKEWFQRPTLMEVQEEITKALINLQGNLEETFVDFEQELFDDNGKYVDMVTFGSITAK